MDTVAIPIDEFMNENWEFFSRLETQADKGLEELSRMLPSSCYEEIRKRLFELMILGGFGGKLLVQCVVDSNIIVCDALRVANGKGSTTERILQSKFIRFLAPPEIVGEVEKNIMDELVGASNLESALAHARRLLSHVQITSIESLTAIDKARLVLSEHLKDVPFLALYFESQADAITTREKGTFDKQGICRWELKEAVSVVVCYESGALSIAIAGAALGMLFEAFQSLVIAILSALVEALNIIVALLSDAARDIAEAISRLPDWAKAVLAIIGGITVIAAIAHDGFRRWIVERLKEIGNALSVMIDTLWRALKELLILIWNTTLPATAIAVSLGGVLIRRICNLVVLSQRLATKASSGYAL